MYPDGGAKWIEKHIIFVLVFFSYFQAIHFFYQIKTVLCVAK